jgi:iron complex transport system permease protein
MIRPVLMLLLGLIAVAVVHLLMPLPPLLALQHDAPATAGVLLAEIRLPRTMLALGYGFVLGMTGAALQALFANPLASPDVTGSSSGAAFGTVFAAYWLGVTGPLVLAAAGAGGAFLALVVMVVLAGRRAETTTMLLAGIAIALAAGAGTSLLLALAPSPFAFYDSFEWLMGSFVDRSLAQAAVALMPAAVCCAFLATRGRALDLMALGEDVVASLGYDPRRLALQVIVTASIAVGTCVSVCGAIGFVGLLAPYAARRLSGGHPGRALVPAGLIGGILLLVADAAVRFGPPGRTIPVGILTTVAGTPLFLWLVVTMRRRVTS